MARFQREAQVLASLNHPNIAAIYGVEERALVLELVEGPTLSDRASALTSFGKLFMGKLWDVYARNVLTSGPF